ncbi:MAG: right-handed parallel beta-helix repeat-containing protein, partial [Pseudonocardiaceae bacterium]
MSRAVKAVRRSPVRMRFGFILGLVGLLLLSGSLEFPDRAAAATNVSGTISTDTTWTLAGSPYVMTDNVYVAAGVTLTIEPGVVVQGSGETRLLTVNGSLAAEGTAGAPITFTSTADSAPGEWHGIRFDSPGGSSTLEYVNVRYGGDGGISKSSGMVEVVAGAVTIEDSTFTASAVSGLRVYGGLSGTDASAVVRRSKFERNGFVGEDRHGDGLNLFNARVVVEDSAFWSNASDGMAFLVGDGYEPAPSEISGSSIWDNRRYGVYSSVEFGAEAFSPDGRVAGKPGNAVYDNGTFGLSGDDKWIQLSVSRASSSVDWSGTYWGPVVSLPCALGSGRGHL